MLSRVCGCRARLLLYSVRFALSTISRAESLFYLFSFPEWWSHECYCELTRLRLSSALPSSLIRSRYAPLLKSNVLLNCISKNNGLLRKKPQCCTTVDTDTILSFRTDSTVLSRGFLLFKAWGLLALGTFSSRLISGSVVIPMASLCNCR